MLKLGNVSLFYCVEKLCKQREAAIHERKTKKMEQEKQRTAAV